MRRPSSTVIVVVGDDAGAVVSGLDALHNVRAAPRGERAPAEHTAHAAHTAATYYVVLSPEEMPPTRRHWWLGVLSGAAPSRVVPARPSTAVVADALGRLSVGRWWPADLEGWLRGLPRVVPDRAGPRI
ncbi:hypothetical protein [Thermomonospora umbrina]|nr:hypothetical protein [Thermomonospora umbrina]